MISPEKDIVSSTHAKKMARKYNPQASSSEIKKIARSYQRHPVDFNILEKKFIEKNPQFNPTQSKFEVKNYNGFKIGEGIPFIGFEWEYSYEP